MASPPLSLAASCRAAVEELASAADLVRWGASRFAEHRLTYGHGTAEAIDEALELVLASLELDPGVPEVLLRARLTRAERERAVALLRRRVVERLPAPYLTRRAWFAGLRFYVDERVLVPRSPIAECIEQGFAPWLEVDAVTRILDLGTGSGCIAIACAHAFPGASVDAVDLSDAALAVARRNVGEHGVEDRVRLLRGDLFAPVDGTYDLIVSNPPYVPTASMSGLAAEYRHEPSSALVAGADGLDCVRRILDAAPAHLAPGAVLVVEVGESRAALERERPEAPFTWLEFARGGDDVLLIGREELAGAGVAGA